MNAEQLLAHYDRVAEAPDAVERLRRFVLALAVRGKLLAQKPSDNTAAELLRLIASEKQKLVLSGELRKPRELGDDESVVAPFSIPSTWQWTRLDSIGAIVGGGTPSASDLENFTEPGTGVPWLTPADLGGHEDLFISRGSRDLSAKGLKSSSATLMPAGSVLFTSRAPIGYVAIAANPISTNQGFKSIVPYVAGCSRFIAMAMTAFAPEIDAKAPGTTFKEVSGKLVAAVPFPLPPLAEQQRIVAKVDELMALCDRLEAARAQREATRDRLTAATLARLNAPEPTPSPDSDAPKASSFQSDARFALSILPAITTRPDQVKQLQQTILNLAVRGSLLPQSTDDQPAASLLKDIAGAREALVARKELKRSKQLPNVGPEEIGHEVPQGWILCRLGDAYDVRDGTHDTPKYVDSGVPLVTSKNLYSGFLSLSDVKLISEQDHAKISERSRVDKDDVLFAMIGSIGNPVIVDTDQPFSIKNVALFKYFDRAHSCPAFLKIFLSNASHKMKILATGGLQPFVSLGFLRAYPMALPPLAEQHRIVAKVDELLSLCDQLEASLTRGENTRSRLLNALLHEALVPTDAALEAA